MAEWQKSMNLWSGGWLVDPLVKPTRFFGAKSCVQQSRLWQNLQILLQLRFVNAWKLPFHSSIPHHLGQQPSISLTFQQGLHGFHFTNGCVTMLSQIQIKGFHLRRLHSQLAQPVQRYQVGLGRIVRPGHHDFSGQLRDRRHAGVLPCHADRNKVAIHVAHA